MGFSWRFEHYPFSHLLWRRANTRNVGCTSLQACAHASARAAIVHRHPSLPTAQVSKLVDKIQCVPYVCASPTSHRDSNYISESVIVFLEFLNCLTQNVSKQFRATDKYERENLPQNLLQNARTGAWNSSINEFPLRKHVITQHAPFSRKGLLITGKSCQLFLSLVYGRTCPSPGASIYTVSVIYAQIELFLDMCFPRTSVSTAVRIWPNSWFC